VTATRLAACRNDIELLLDGRWLRLGCCVVVKANVRVLAYFGGPLKVKPQVTRRKHLHVRDRPHVVHRRVTGVARGTDLPYFVRPLTARADPGRCVGPLPHIHRSPHSRGAGTRMSTLFGRALRCRHVGIQTGRTGQPIRCRIDRNDGDRIPVARPGTSSSPRHPESAWCCRGRALRARAVFYGVGNAGAGNGARSRGPNCARR
jgi:hypothetical protein